MPGGPGKVLDFGCGPSCMSLIAAKKGFESTAIDLEAQNFLWKHPDVKFIQGDILKVDLPLQYFDLIINCSSIEHVGLAGRFSVEDGSQDADLEAMSRLNDLMKMGATMLLAIPVGRDAVFAPFCRIYGDKRTPKLLNGFDVSKEEFWLKSESNCWQPCSRQDALSFNSSAGSADPRKAIYALGFFILRKIN